MAAKAFAAAAPLPRDPTGPAQPQGARYPVVSIVRSVQRRDKHEPCFRTDARYVCMEFECRWRKDCLHLVAEWCR